jgi:predicted transcriptional regulator
MLESGRSLAVEFAKTHGMKAQDVMTADVLTAGPDTPVRELADMMERNGVKRIPIVVDGQVVGVVSRANLVQALASGMHEVVRLDSDEALRQAVVAALDAKAWGRSLVNVIVRDGKVDLWGVVDNEDVRKAIRIAAERVAGVDGVNDNLRVFRVLSAES